MNAIAAHKDELKKLLENLSGDIAVSEITFAALVDAYITRLDANCSDINAGVTPLPGQIKGELYGTNIDSELLGCTTRSIQLQSTAPRFSKDFARQPATKRRILTGN
jgi:hypothetical protein